MIPGFKRFCIQILKTQKVNFFLTILLVCVCFYYSYRLSISDNNEQLPILQNANYNLQNAWSSYYTSINLLFENNLNKKIKNYSLYDSSGHLVTLRDLCGSKREILVLSYDVRDCDKCIMKIMDSLRSYTHVTKNTNMDIRVLVYSTQINDAKLFSASFGHSFPIFTISPKNPILVSTGSIGTPYLFSLRNDLHISSIFIPSFDYPFINAPVFNALKNKLHYYSKL